MLFPPLEFSAELLDKGIRDGFGQPPLHYLTDGGVVDNLGLTALLHHPRDSNHGEQALIILCNAGRRIDWDFRTNYSRKWMLSLLRSSEIAQHWAEQRLVQHAPIGTANVNIWDTASPGSAPPVDIQEKAARIRTDFDTFSDIEWQLLFDHGYSVANKVLAPLLFSREADQAR